MNDHPSLHVDGLPPGTRAVAADPTPDRRGRVKTDRFRLLAADPPDRPDLDGLAPTDLDFALASRRAWTTIARRYSESAVEVTADRVRRGLIIAEGTAGHDRRTGALTVTGWTCWRATEAATNERTNRARARTEDHAATTTAAAAAADRIDAAFPALAATLRDPGRRSPAIVEALVHAANDLADSRTFDGPRAWSQTHYPHVQGDPSKHRADIAKLLAEADEPDAAESLGVDRPGDFGIGGTLRASDGHGRVLVSEHLHGIARIDPTQPLQLLPLDPNAPLVVVENLQAAHTAATSHRAAVIYTGGVPSERVTQLAADAATRASGTLIVCDADLGGVRIAERIADAAPGPVHVIDIGEQPHTPTTPFDRVYAARLERHLAGPAGGLAAAVLARGYRLEQEAVTRAALTAVLA